MADLGDAVAAYHEAGHVLTAHLQGAEVLEATLEAEDEAHAGLTKIAWRGFPTDERTRASALVALAGPVAEILWRGEEVFDDDLSAWHADEQEVEAALAALVPVAERFETRRRWLAEVSAVLQEPTTWECLCRIADALEAHQTLDQALLSDLLS